MLNNKGGLITDERFKNLTPLQWYYHYNQIMIKEENDKKYEADKIKNIIEVLAEIIFQAAENSGIISNEAFDVRRFIEEKTSKKFETNIGMPEDEAGKVKFMEELLKVIPKELHIINEKIPNKNFLPVFDRKKKVKGIGKINNGGEHNGAR